MGLGEPTSWGRDAVEDSILHVAPSTQSETIRGVHDVKTNAVVSARRGRHLRRTLVGIAAVAAAMFALAGTAGAYGGKAAYQVGFAFNCDNHSSPFCALPPAGFGLGGEWGWYAFNSDGTFDAQLTFCAHGQGINGAGHQSEDGLWEPGPAQVPVFGETTDFYVSLDGGSTWQDTMIPYGVGHYSAKLGPGVSAEAQVSGG